MDTKGIGVEKNTKELDANANIKIAAYVLHLHYQPCRLGIQQTESTKRVHQVGLSMMIAGRDCVPTAPAVLVRLTRGGLVDTGATAEEVCDADA
jgi:hypothetical protein